MLYKNLYLLIIFSWLVSACFHEGPTIRGEESQQDTEEATEETVDTSGLPTLTVTSEGGTDFTVNESQSTFSYLLTLSKPVNEDIVVAYQVVGVVGVSNSATRQDDFLLFTQGRNASSDFVTIAANTTEASFTVNIVDDRIDESDEVFAVNLKLAVENLSDAKANLINTQIITTIVDDDVLPIVGLKTTNTEIVVKESVGAIEIVLEMPVTQSNLDVEIPIIWDYPSVQAATPGEDFIEVKNITYPGFSNGFRDLRTYSFKLLINDDAVKEDTETFFFSLNNPLDGLATLRDDQVQLTIIIEDDDALGGINDTQIDECANSTEAAVSCASATDFPGQDGESHTPFSTHLKKITAAGQETIHDSETVCIKDMNTGLLWEVKKVSNDANNPDYRDKGHLYSWYNTLPNLNGGNIGILGTLNSCSETLDDCSTNTYIKKLNSENSGSGLCYNKNWRLPKVQELISIMSFTSFLDPSNEVMIDTQYFPNTAGSYYWTSTPTSEFRARAWAVYFGKTPSGQPATEFSVPYEKTENLFVRAVANDN